MKNNRPIEVGQVRMFKKFEDGTGWEDSMYVVNSLEGILANIRYITGDEKGTNTSWLICILEEDIVVM